MARMIVLVLSLIFWIASAVIAFIAVLSLLGLRSGAGGDTLVLAGVLALVAIAGVQISAVV